MKQNKHVIAVVVEGYTDEDALGTILSQFFESDEVRFVICHGDITTDKTVDSKNVVRRVNNLIARVMDQYSYKKSSCSTFIRHQPLMESRTTYTSTHEILSMYYTT